MLVQSRTAAQETEAVDDAKKDPLFSALLDLDTATTCANYRGIPRSAGVQLSFNLNRMYDVLGIASDNQRPTLAIFANGTVQDGTASSARLPGVANIPNASGVRAFRQLHERFDDSKTHTVRASVSRCRHTSARHF